MPPVLVAAVFVTHVYADRMLKSAARYASLLVSRLRSSLLHRGRRGARLARREEGEYRDYATDEQRSQARGPQRGSRVGVQKGCIAGRLQTNF